MVQTEFSVICLWLVNFRSSIPHSCVSASSRSNEVAMRGVGKYGWSAVFYSKKISIFRASISIFVSHLEGRRYIGVSIFCPTPTEDWGVGLNTSTQSSHNHSMILPAVGSLAIM